MHIQYKLGYKITYFSNFRLYILHMYTLVFCGAVYKNKVIKGAFVIVMLLFSV